MDSVRLVQCAVAACGQPFFLCSRCDRGRIYCARCGPGARRATRRASRRGYPPRALQPDVGEGRVGGAPRDGVPPIELVDGEKLVTMFERAGIGLRPVQSYELDEAFFDELKV